jgi:hypothetical protein
MYPTFKFSNLQLSEAFSRIPKFRESKSPNRYFRYLCTSFFKTMGRGRKTQREMNRLIKAIKRKRILKKAAHRSFARPESANAVSAPAETAAVETTAAETTAE